jgi:hypothetical protein
LRASCCPGSATRSSSGHRNAFGTRGAGATPLIVVGACLFYLSDLSVAALRFTEPPLPTYVLGLPLYYAGQVCLAFSVAAARIR